MKRAWLVSVRGYGAAITEQPSAGAALAWAWRHPAFDGLTYREFLGRRWASARAIPA